MAKYPKKDLEVFDRICMTKGSPIKEGTVMNYDEVQAYIKFDDLTLEWVDLGHFYITAKGHDITLADGKSWFVFVYEKQKEREAK